MRKLIVSEFITVDGVMEAPGGETSLGDRSGWTLPYQSKDQGKFKYDELFASDALLLGRKTYEGFAAAWPTLTGTGKFGEQMNSIQKYVVTTTLDDLAWNNSKAIKENIAAKILELKHDPGKDILVYGSAELVQTLVKSELVDEYRLMIFPVILGIGKRLFADGDLKKPLKLVDEKTFDSGVALLTYQPDKK